MRRGTWWAIAGLPLRLVRWTAWAMVVAEGGLALLSAPLLNSAVRDRLSEQEDLPGRITHPAQIPLYAALFAACALLVALSARRSGRWVDHAYALSALRPAVGPPPVVSEPPDLTVRSAEPPAFGRPGRRRSQPLGRLLVAAGAGLNVLAVAAYGAALGRISSALLAAQVRLGLDGTALALGCALLLLAAAAQAAAPRCMRRGRRHLVAVPGSLDAALAEPYVLYLRPFGTDASMAAYPAGLAASPHQVSTSGSTLTVEELLSGTLRRAGRLLAVGHPEEALPPPGAARVYLPWNNWEPTVLALLRRAELVVLGTGLARGTLWEFGQAVRHRDPTGLVLLLYSDAAHYTAFRRIADRFLPDGRGLPEPPVPRGTDRGSVPYPLTAVITFGPDWRSTLHPLDLSRSRLRGRDLLGEDVRLQLYALFQRVFRPGPSRTPTPSRKQRARALTSAIAGCSLQGLVTALAIAQSVGGGSPGAVVPVFQGMFGVLLSPAGALLAGVAADRWGRRPALLATAAAVGAGALPFAFVPQPGLPSTLVLLSLLWLAIGGEVALAVVLLAETAAPGRRATVLGWYFAGSTAVSVLLVVAGASATAAGWDRAVPLVSTGLVLVLLGLRRGLWEPRSRDELSAPGRGLLEPFRRHPGTVAVVVLLSVCVGFVSVHVTGPAHSPVPVGLLVVLLPVLGRVSDRWNRRAVLVAAGCAVAAVMVAQALAAPSSSGQDIVLRCVAAPLVAVLVPAAIASLGEITRARLRAATIGPAFALAMTATAQIEGIHTSLGLEDVDPVLPSCAAALYLAAAVVSLRCRGIGHEPRE